MKQSTIHQNMRLELRRGVVQGLWCEEQGIPENRVDTGKSPASMPCSIGRPG